MSERYSKERGRGARRGRSPPVAGNKYSRIRSTDRRRTSRSRSPSGRYNGEDRYHGEPQAQGLRRGGRMSTGGNPGGPGGYLAGSQAVLTVDRAPRFIHVPAPPQPWVDRRTRKMPHMTARMSTGAGWEFAHRPRSWAKGSGGIWKKDLSDREQGRRETIWKSKRPWRRDARNSCGTPPSNKAQDQIFRAYMLAIEQYAILTQRFDGWKVGMARFEKARENGRYDIVIKQLLDLSNFTEGLRDLLPILCTKETQLHHPWPIASSADVRKARKRLQRALIDAWDPLMDYALAVLNATGPAITQELDFTRHVANFTTTAWRILRKHKPLHDETDHWLAGVRNSLDTDLRKVKQHIGKLDALEWPSRWRELIDVEEPDVSDWRAGGNSDEEEEGEVDEEGKEGLGDEKGEDNEEGSEEDDEVEYEDEDTD